MIPNQAIIAGYLEGTIKGQLSNVECMRQHKLMTDKELLDQMIERLKLALDTAKTMVG
jgi:hypothetical protein